MRRQAWRRRTAGLLLAGALAGCGPTTSPVTGTAVDGEVFEREIVGRVMSFRLPGGRPGAGRLAEAQFQPDGTAVYRGGGAAPDGIGRWRPWAKGYCALYPWIGRSSAERRPYAGPADADGYRCYVVRAGDGYYALFQPDGVFVGTLVPVG